MQRGRVGHARDLVDDGSQPAGVVARRREVLCRERPERTARNPSTGEQIQKPADKVVKITVAKALKDSINA